MAIHQPNPETDPFRPPAIPTEVFCMHCQQEYESYLMEWREERAEDGRRKGFWCCPTPGCDGKGFGFDIYPIDPDYCDEEGQPMSPFGEVDDEDADPFGPEWLTDEEEGDLSAWSGDPIDADALLNDEDDESYPPSGGSDAPPPIDQWEDRPDPPRRPPGNDDGIPW